MARVKKPASPKFTGYLFLIIGVIALVAGSFEVRAARKFVTQGIDVPGTITKTRVATGSKNKKTYYLQVAYDLDGGPHQREFSVRKSFYTTRTNSDGRVTNPQVEVRYLPDAHEKAIIKGGESNPYAFVFVGSLFALGGLAFLYYGYTRKRAPVIA